MTGASRSHRSWLQRSLIGFNVVLVVLCLTAAGALGFYNKQLSDVPRVALGGDVLAQRSDPGEPQNFLIVGADDDTGLDASDPILKGRGRSTNTDTIMILRVDPKQEKAQLLSIPRDTWVSIPPSKGKQKINGAVSLGGPQKLIETIQANFGIPIHHYLQVNFFGFKQLVDTLGGVNVYFNHPARDTHTGLAQYDPGCVNLDGEAGLAFARSRYYEANIDGKWKQDPASDFDRIKRQQYFVKQAMKKAVDKGARNPVEMANLLGVAQKYVVIDDTLTAKDLLDLGSHFANFDPETLEQYSLGDYSHGAQIGAASAVVLDVQKAQPVLDLFRGVSILTDAAAATRVSVTNGSGRAGVGATTVDDLRRAGFTVPGDAVDGASFRNGTTVIRYAPGLKTLAVLVARYTDTTVTYEEVPAMADGDVNVTLVIGKDFTGVRGEPRPESDFASELQPGDTTPAPVDGAQSTDTTAPAQTTVTTNPFVPEPPEGTTC
jgi:LCP family protein required for cell wall assembly